jgi:hypothetical protein
VSVIDLQKKRNEIGKSWLICECGVRCWCVKTYVGVDDDQDLCEPHAEDCKVDREGNPIPSNFKPTHVCGQPKRGAS